MSSISKPSKVECVRAHIHTHACAHTHTMYTCTHYHTHMHAHTHTHTLSQTHTHTITHTHSRGKVMHQVYADNGTVNCTHLDGYIWFYYLRWVVDSWTMVLSRSRVRWVLVMSAWPLVHLEQKGRNIAHSYCLKLYLNRDVTCTSLCSMHSLHIKFANSLPSKKNKSLHRY